MVLIDSTLEAIANAAAATTAIAKAGSAPVDPKILSAVAAIVPIITYPFLPWDGKMDDHQLTFYLIYLGFLWIPFFHLPNLTLWLFGKDSVCLPVCFWVLPLTLCTTVVGNAGLTAKGEHRKVAPADFDDAVSFTLIMFIYQLFRLGMYFATATGFLYATEVFTWLDVVGTLGLILLAVFGGGCIAAFFLESVKTAFYKFTTRQVSWWTWLQPKDNSSKNEFLLTLSYILPIFLFIAPPVLLFMTVYAIGNN